MVAVIGLSVTTTLLVTRSDDSSEGTPHERAPENSHYASANDTGPANLIIEDPTCEAWSRIGRDYVATLDSVKWTERDPKTPAAQWVPAQIEMYEVVGKSLSASAELVDSLIGQTPHRAMRELYTQFNAYSRTFVDALPVYQASDDALTSVISGLVSAASNICAAIDYRAVQSIAPLVVEPDAPSQGAGTNSSERFMPTKNATCQEWIAAGNQYREDTEQWRGVDGKISAQDWTPEQKAIYDDVGPVMEAYADTIERLGRQSRNATFEDFAVLAAQYTRAYVVAIPRYTSADNFMSQSALYLSSTIYSACEAAS